MQDIKEIDIYGFETAIRKRLTEFDIMPFEDETTSLDVGFSNFSNFREVGSYRGTDGKTKEKHSFRRQKLSKEGNFNYPRFYLVAGFIIEILCILLVAIYHRTHNFGIISFIISLHVVLFTLRCIRHPHLRGRNGKAIPACIRSNPHDVDFWLYESSAFPECEAG